MDWYSVGLAAAVGAAAGVAAAVIATLVMPKRAEQKTAYVVVFVCLFALLHALARHFILPVLTLPHEMQKVEQALLALPAFQAMKQYDATTYGEVLADLRMGLKKGTKEEELVAQMRPRMEQLIQERLPTASDHAVVTYISAMTREMRELRRQDPVLCYKFLFPQVYGAVNLHNLVPKELIDADLAALAEVIKTSAESPQPIPTLENVSVDLGLVIAELQQKHGDNAGVLQDLHAPNVDKATGCDVTADLYDIINALPPERSSDLLRYMFSQG